MQSKAKQVKQNACCLYVLWYATKAPNWTDDLKENGFLHNLEFMINGQCNANFIEIYMNFDSMYFLCELDDLYKLKSLAWKGNAQWVLEN